MLRTLPPPSSVMADALKLGWAWRNKADRALLRSTLLVLIALVFSVATIAASVFSSLVVDTGTIDVLVDSPHCGRVGAEGRTASNDFAFGSYSGQIDQLVPKYTSNCYRNGTLPKDCEVFMQPNVQLKAQAAPCPLLNKTWCDTKEAFELDSGLVDVSKTFGLNLPAKDRVQYRKKTTCTVLPIEDHYKTINLDNFPDIRKTLRNQGISGYIPSEELLVLLYGPSYGSILPEATSVMSLLMSNITTTPQTYAGTTNFGAPDIEVNAWNPVAGLEPIEKRSGDLFWKPVMPNAVVYEDPVDDPLYAAHKKYLLLEPNTKENTTRYGPDHPIKLLCCLQQHEFCHVRNNKGDFCTPLQYMPSYDLSSTYFPEASSVQLAILQLLIASNWLYRIAYIQTLKAQKLKMSIDQTIASIPDGFWKEEVLGWEQSLWASLQIMIPQYAIGPKAIDKNADLYLAKPKTDGEKVLCSTQKMKTSSGFVNINFFGLVFIVTFSVTAMLIDITILKILVYLSRFRRRLGPRVERWMQDGVWQLQRRAYEGEGQRGWTKLESEVPLTNKGKMLKDLPILWVPEKSPAVVQSTTSESTGPQGTVRPDGHTVNGDDQQKASHQKWWHFWKRS